MNRGNKKSACKAMYTKRCRKPTQFIQATTHSASAEELDEAAALAAQEKAAEAMKNLDKSAQQDTNMMLTQMAESSAMLRVDQGTTKVTGLRGSFAPFRWGEGGRVGRMRG